MQTIKPLLILCFVLILVVVFRYRSRVGMRAGARVLAVLLTAAAVVAVAVPDIPQAMAEQVGVARGTDLLLYGLVSTPADLTRHVETLSATLPSDAAALVADQMATLVRIDQEGLGVALIANSDDDPVLAAVGRHALAEVLAEDR